MYSIEEGYHKVPSRINSTVEVESFKFHLLSSNYIPPLLNSLHSADGIFPQYL